MLLTDGVSFRVLGGWVVGLGRWARTGRDRARSDRMDVSAGSTSTPSGAGQTPDLARPSRVPVAGRRGCRLRTRARGRLFRWVFTFQSSPPGPGKTRDLARPHGPSPVPVGGRARGRLFGLAGWSPRGVGSSPDLDRPRPVPRGAGQPDRCAAAAGLVWWRHGVRGCGLQ